MFANLFKEKISLCQEKLEEFYSNFSLLTIFLIIDKKIKTLKIAYRFRLRCWLLMQEIGKNFKNLIPWLKTLILFKNMVIFLSRKIPLTKEILILKDIFILLLSNFINNFEGDSSHFL